MIRTLAAVVAGLVVALVVMTLVEAVGHVVFPPPEGLDPMTPEGMTAIVAHMSPAALLFLLVAHVCGAMAGGGAASKVAATGRHGEALVVGFVLMCAVLVNVITIPHPAWIRAASVAVQLPAAWLGSRLVVGRPS